MVNLPKISTLFKALLLSQPCLKVSFYCFCVYFTLNKRSIIVIIGCITYFTVIFGGQYLLSHSSPVKCKIINQFHNAFLTIVSLVLLLLLIEQLVPRLVNQGLYFTICSEDAWTQELELLYYLNYLVKYYELVDTIFLVIKRKKLGKYLSLSWTKGFHKLNVIVLYRISSLFPS